MIDKDISKDQAQKYVQASFDLLDQLSVMQSSEVITGVKSNAVAIDHEFKLQLAQNSASQLARDDLVQVLKKQGINVKEGSKGIY